MASQRSSHFIIIYGSDGKESTCNGVDPGSIPGSDSKESACNGGDPVQSLGQEDPLEKGCGYPIPCLENPMVGGGGTWLPQANGVAKSQTRHN